MTSSTALSVIPQTRGRYQVACYRSLKSQGTVIYDCGAPPSTVTAPFDCKVPRSIPASAVSVKLEVPVTSSTALSVIPPALAVATKLPATVP